MTTDLSHSSSITQWKETFYIFYGNKSLYQQIYFGKSLSYFCFACIIYTFFKLKPFQNVAIAPQGGKTFTLCKAFFQPKGGSKVLRFFFSLIQFLSMLFFQCLYVWICPIFQKCTNYYFAYPKSLAILFHADIYQVILLSIWYKSNVLLRKGIKYEQSIKTKSSRDPWKKKINLKDLPGLMKW